MTSEKRSARAAGLWYLAIAVFYSFSMIYVDSLFLVSGDVEATVKNLQASSQLFRLGWLSCLVGHVCFLFLANALYRLFSPVSRSLARQMVLLVIAGVTVSFLNRLGQIAALEVLGGGSYLAAFAPAQRNALAMLLLTVNKDGEMMAALFWALWLLPLGLLILKSGFMPKALGILLLCACASYLVDFFVYFFFPNLVAAIDAPFSLVQAGSELAFIVWLLVKGVKEGKAEPVQLPA